ncbi:hypothetical protein AYI69_g9950 [Smittium culicis]|uniref:Uncharacterized protein n=1 Tax=Smittium culicis TaxID=133412 RepID=A0A1R1X940_9FUNG|nr:hypothetical protein AYI69_g9950 [Smittium culicis]
MGDSLVERNHTSLIQQHHQIIEDLQCQIQKLAEVLGLGGNANHLIAHPEGYNIGWLYSTEVKSYYHGTWDINQENNEWLRKYGWEQNLVSKSIYLINGRNYEPSRGYYKSIELNINLMLSN